MRQNPDGLQRFAQFTSLNCVNRKVSLVNFNIGPAFVEKLVAILTAPAMRSKVASLSLAKNQLKDQGAAKLCALLRKTSIIHLDISCNKITSSGFGAIFKSLETNCTLVSLRIGNDDSQNLNKLGVQGCAYLKTLLGRQAANGGVLAELNLRWLSIGDNGVV